MCYVIKVEFDTNSRVVSLSATNANGEARARVEGARTAEAEIENLLARKGKDN